jgi:hypothetical protein
MRGNASPHGRREARSATGATFCRAMVHGADCSFLYLLAYHFAVPACPASIPDFYLLELTTSHAA